MSTDFSTGASHEPVASCATAFACLLRLSSQLCSDGEGGSVYCRGVVEGDSLPLSRLVEFAGQLGLEAKHARSNWQGLQAIGFKHSILALLKNTNLVLLTGTRPSVGEAVAAWDPLDRHGGVQFVQRENFEAVWTGDVVIITTRILRKSEAPNRLDFCWLTPTGLQLLGRKSDNRQRLKLFHRASDDTGVQYTAAARNARQQAESVLARDSGSEPSVTAGTAMQASSWPPLAALTGRGEWRRWIIRLYLAAAAILAIGSTGLFLLGYPAAGILAVAVNAATKGSEDVPNSGSSGDHATMRGADRLPENARRLRSANAACSPPSLPNTLPTQAALRIGPPPEVAIPAPALPDPPAVEAAGIPSGSARASLATSAPPATTAAPTGSGDPATLSKDPLPATAAANPAPVASAAPAAAAASAAAMPAPTEPSGEPRIPAAEMATLLARGDALLSTGDTTSARLFYQRAADAGAGLAAVRLGETFDPAFLDRAHLRGARGDPGQAVSWYRRALDLGVTDAEVLLKALRNN
jgi:hypothetical protein